MEHLCVELEAAVGALFRRHPELCGFTVQDFEGELVLADLGVYPCAGTRDTERVGGDVAAALLELINECPEALDLLRGRTFARVLH